MVEEQCYSLQDVPENLDKQEQIMKDIEMIYEERVKASMFRAKARWHREGEQNTKYSFKLEKQKYNAKVISALVRPDGTFSRNQKEILTMQAKFYENLYTVDIEILFTFENNSDIKLTEEEKSDTDRMITKDELFKAMNSVRPARTPGCDGISSEF